MGIQMLRRFHIMLQTKPTGSRGTSFWKVVCLMLFFSSLASATDLYQQFELKGKVLKVTISYEEDLQSVQEASYEEIRFNASGTQATHTIYQPIGFELSVRTYLWNPVARTLHAQWMEENRPYGTWDSKFDANGCETETRIVLADDPRKRTELRQCDSKGQPLKVKKFTAGEGAPVVVTYLYQKNGQVLEKEQEPDRPQFQDYVVYNSKGLPIEKGFFSSGQKNPMYRFEYQFDPRGNWIRRTQYGWIAEEGKWGSARVRITGRTITYR